MKDILFYPTSEEIDILTKKAEKLGMSLSEYISYLLRKELSE